MKGILWLVAWVFLATLGGLPGASQAGEGGLLTLRGATALTETTGVPEARRWIVDTRPIPRDYVQQPPLIPHTVEMYTINLRNNKCLDCHSWETYKETGATKISLTHFRDRLGSEMSDVSPQRYFCNQCHVPQADARPLVENSFKPVNALR
ncbi:MAG: nitrate reductase cytochrome c-type subunit [Magnetococcus sp. WYHC-3]